MTDRRAPLRLRGLAAAAIACVLALPGAARAQSASVVTTSPDPAHEILSPAFEAATVARSRSTLTHGNVQRFLENGAVSGPVKRSLAQSATRTLFVTTMNWDHDQSGQAFAQDLVQASARGVDVRAIVDGIFADPRIVWKLRQGGVKVLRYNFLFSAGWSRRGRIHQKMVVADLARAVVGGPNIGDKYWLGDGQNGYFHDVDLEVEGAAAVETARHFLTLWKELLPSDASAQALLADPVFQAGPGAPRGGRAGVARFIDHEPDVGRTYVTDFYVRTIRAAKTQVVWHINNFDPAEPIMGELEAAAARGVRVVLVINSPASFARKFPAPFVWYFEMLALYARFTLAGTGIEMGQLDEPIHSKALTIDGVMASIGSFNFHRTAIGLNLECTLVSYDPAVIGAVERMFDRDMARGRRVL